MDDSRTISDEQAKLWNGNAGHAWVDSQKLLDDMFRPFENLLVAAVTAESAGQVLDIGCGTGSTALAVARAMGANGRCTGIDISQPMIATAKQRAARENAAVEFICADAQDYTFDVANFDMLISRFGVMFFGNPANAFTNLRRATRPLAKLHCIGWRSAAENPFMTTAERAAAPLLPNLPARKPGAAGQFAFADKDHVQAILQRSGWSDIAMTPLDITCRFPATELTHYLTRLGPLGLLLQDINAPTRSHIVETVRAAFEPYVHGTEVRFDAACWLIGARS